VRGKERPTLDSNPGLLAMFESHGISRDHLQHGYDLYPFLSIKSAENTEKKVEVLKELGMTSFQIGRVLMKSPSFFGLSIEKNIQPRLTQLRSFGLNDEMICRLMSRSPVTFSFSMNQGFLKRLRFVEKIVGKDNFVACVTVYPSLIIHNPETRWQVFINIFQKELGIEGEDLGRVVRLCPTAVGFNYNKNLIPKIRALIRFYEAQGQSLETARTSAREMVMKYPAFLGLSLENRIRTRLDYHLRLPRDAEGMPPVFKYMLMKRTDEQFKVLLSNLPKKKITRKKKAAATTTTTTTTAESSVM